MLSNISPWITQLKRTRPVKHLSSNTNTDVVVIGGGIAGISTAYYLLCKTKKNVILIDADKVGHGATGHNAGQAVSYFETPFSDMVSKYGLEMAGDAVRAAESGFELIEEIFANAEIKTKFYRFTGYAGFMYLEIVIQHLETKYWGLKAGLDIEQIFVAENAPWLDKIPERYKGLYSILPQSSILSCLETDNKGYFAMMSMDKGVMNSAIFSEEATFMLKVKGDSMIDAGIREGDMVLVERGKQAKPGQIVIAEVDGEYTMKYLRMKDGKHYLEAANEKYKPIYPKNELQVEAIVSAVIRKY
jgi:hypothetical protein